MERSLLEELNPDNQPEEITLQEIIEDNNKFLDTLDTYKLVNSILDQNKPLDKSTRFQLFHKKMAYQYALERRFKHLKELLESYDYLYSNFPSLNICKTLYRKAVDELFKIKQEIPELD